jgi:hypothetical protein
MSNHIDMMKRQTRNHTGLEWESNNLNSQFTDINRVALDDNYGKVGAPLSKRRNGEGPADRTAQPGLFGPIAPQASFTLNKLEDAINKHFNPTNIILGITIAGAIWYYKK